MRDIQIRDPRICKCMIFLALTRSRRKTNRESGAQRPRFLQLASCKRRGSTYSASTSARRLNYVTVIRDYSVAGLINIDYLISVSLFLLFALFPALLLSRNLVRDQRSSAIEHR